MKKYFSFCAFVFLWILPVFSQTLAPERRSDWQHAGRQTPLPDYSYTLDINDFGGKGDSITLNEPAFEAALTALQGQPGVIFFPAGKYLFHNTIQLRDSLIIRGAGAGATTFFFDLAGAAKDCVVARGMADLDVQATPLSQAAVQGDTILWIGANGLFQVGDLLKLHFDDSLFITSAWALGSAGQLFEVLEVGNNGWLKINHPLRFDLPLSLQPRLSQVFPIDDAGIECLKIKRLDPSVSISSNILFLYARRCWIAGVESQSCNFAHLALDASAHCEVYGSYFREAFAYGGGGQGYGIAGEFTSSDNRVQNCIFQHLRHSILLQSGATGNVFAYNFSSDPVWEEIPNNGAGELVLHGNYPSYNLFEGNICENIRPDGSHGANGSFNTFFRNRTTGYGFIITGTQVDFNIMGNEIVPGGLFQGLYLVTGTNHLEYGNNVGGVITPAGTTGAMDSSLYFKRLPSFLDNNDFLIGPPKALNTALIPAQERFLAGGEKTDCDARMGLSVAATEPPVLPDVFTVSPNPFRDRFTVKSAATEGLEVYDLRGKLWFRSIAPAAVTDVICANWPIGVYVVRLRGGMAVKLLMKM